MVAIGAACGSSSKSGSPTTTAGSTTTAGGSSTSAASPTSAAPTTATTAAPKPYNVTVAVGGDPESMDPQKIQDAPARTWFGDIFEPLVRFAADGKSIVPVLAASLPKNIDPTTWEVTLRTDVKFGSGKAFTADDVVYSYQRLLDPKYDTQQRDLISTITSVTAVDAKTVRFTTKDPDPNFIERITYPFILAKGEAEVAGFPDKGYDGTGPYQLVSHTPAVDTVIKKRSDYWGGDISMAPDQVTYKVVPDTAAQLAGLQTGELDIVTEIGTDAMSQVPQAKSLVTTETALLRTNTLKGPFKDPKLREAANLAIDRASIVKQLYNDQAKVATCQIATPNVFGFTSSLQTPAYDPAMAKQLVKDNYHGETITMYGVQGRFPKQPEIGQAIQAQLQAVGFKVNLVFPTSTDVLYAQFGAGPKSGFVDLLFFQAGSEFFDEFKPLQWLISTGVYSAINDPQIDQLAAAAQTSFDSTQRQSDFDKLNKLACDNVYNIYLYSAPNVYGLSKRIDWQPRPDDLILLQDVRPKS